MLNAKRETAEWCVHKHSSQPLEQRKSSESKKGCLNKPCGKQKPGEWSPDEPDEEGAHKVQAVSDQRAGTQGKPAIKGPGVIAGTRLTP